MEFGRTRETRQLSIRKPIGWNVESLEDRRLLAQYALEVNLYEDQGGAPGDLIADETVDVGQRFFMEITAKDLRDQPLGLAGLGLGVYWDANVFEEIDPHIGPADVRGAVVTSAFPTWRGGELDNANGYIDNLGGMTDAPLGPGKLIGVHGAERFALLHFQAEQPDAASSIRLRIRGGVGFVPMRHYSSEDLSIENVRIRILPAEERIAPVPANSTTETILSVHTVFAETDTDHREQSVTMRSEEPAERTASAVLPDWSSLNIIRSTNQPGLQASTDCGPPEARLPLNEKDSVATEDSSPLPVARPAASAQFIGGLSADSLATEVSTSPVMLPSVNHEPVSSFPVSSNTVHPRSLLDPVVGSDEDRPRPVVISVADRKPPGISLAPVRAAAVDAIFARSDFVYSHHVDVAGMNRFRKFAWLALGASKR